MKTRRAFLSRTLVAGGALAALPGVQAQQPHPAADSPVWNVRAHGAAGDGSRLDTGALQKVIDACSAGGGGVVYFPPGNYLSGTLMLKSGVTLKLSAGAALRGSRRLEDYPACVPAARSFTDTYTEKSLIYAENVHDVGLEGPGTIDGQGGAFKGPYKVRPYLIRFIGCQDVLVRDIFLKDSPMWVQHYLACDRVHIDGIRVHSHCNSNNDGIDIDGCHNVRISGCDISSGDDAIVLKSTLDRPCRHVVVTNCILSSDCNAFKLGTESNGGFENIVFGNCAIHNTRLSGVALELVDGGRLDGVNVSNVTMQNVRSGIFIRLGNRARPFRTGQPKPGQGSLRNVMLCNIQATGLDRIGCSITGLTGYPVENITLENIRLSFGGGGTVAQVRSPLPEQADKYPEYSMFGVLPAYGLYCRHGRNLRFRDLQVTCAKPDERPSLAGEDVEDWEISGWQAKQAPKEQPIIQLRDVRRSFIHGCCVPPQTPVFLRVEGKTTNRIRLAANDLSFAAKLVEFGPDAAETMVTIDEPDRAKPRTS